MSERVLSMKSKVTLLNTVILSKVWYLATVIPMPENTFKEIEGILRDFIWTDDRYRNIKLAHFYLPISKGGLGLLHPKHQSAALRLKYFFYITDKNKDAVWLKYARYWLTYRLNKYKNKDWDFLLKIKCAKYNATLPPISTDDIDNTIHISYWDSMGIFPYHYKNMLNMYITPFYNELVNLPQYSTKQIYNKLILIHYKDHQINTEYTWNVTFKMKIPWHIIWSHNYSSYAIGPCQDVLYKLLHNAHTNRAKQTKYRGKKTSRISPYCKSCSKRNTNKLEDTLHIFARCPNAIEIWKFYKITYHKLLPGKPYIYENVALTLNLVYHKIPKQNKKLALTLTTIILSEIWRSRNKHERENIKPNTKKTISRINIQLTNIIKAHYNEHKQKDTLDMFSDRFTTNEAFCKLQNGKLIITLPE